MKMIFKKFTILFSGIVLSQILSIISVPLLSRAYSPEEFGELSFFISITGVLSLFGSLKLNEAIMVARNEKEKSIIFGSIIFIHLLVLIITFFISVILIIFDVFEISDFLMLLIPFNLVLYSLFVTSGILFIKEDTYKKVSKSHIDRSLSLNISQLIFSYSSLFNGLLLGNLVGNLFGMKLLVKNIKGNLKYISYSNMKYILRKYSNFPLYNLPQALFNNLSSALPHIILIIPFGASNIGLFYMIMKLLNLPTVLISNIITNIYYKNVSDLYNDNNRIFKVYTLTIFLLLIIGGPILLIVISADNLIISILGNDWKDAGYLIPWIALWTFSMFVYMPATKTIIILGIQKYFMYYTIFELISRLTILIIGISYLNFYNTIKYLSLFNTISNFIIIIIIFICIYYKDKRMSLEQRYI